MSVRDVLIDLSRGAPALGVPDSVSQAFRSARLEEFNGYAPMGGVPALRKAIASHLSHARDREVEQSSVVVTSGASMGIFASILCLRNRFLPADLRVLVPTPGFPLYDRVCETAGAQSLAYRVLRAEESGEALICELPDGDVLVWNFPHNPTGLIASPEAERCALEWLAADPNRVLIADETFSASADEFRSIDERASECLSQRIVTVDGFSKSYGLADFRIGYVAGPASLLEGVSAVQWAACMSTSKLSQYLALVALELGDEFGEHLRTSLRERRRLTEQLVRDELGVLWTPPPAGFFAFLDVEERGLTGTDVAVAALSARVLVSPGDHFGLGQEAWAARGLPAAQRPYGHFFRMNLAVREDDLLEGVTRLGRALSGDLAALRVTS